MQIHILLLPCADIITKLTADGLLWRHGHMGQPLAIMMSQWSIVPQVSMDAWCWGRREFKGLQAHGANDGLAAVGGKFKLSKWYIHKLHIFVYFPLHFQTPVFQHRALLV